MNKIMSIKNWLQTPVSKKFFLATVFIYGILHLFFLLITQCLDPDMFFLISTGDYILKNGIPTIHPWHIEKNLEIVVQQWLYTVIISIFAKLGAIGLYLLSLINFLMLCYVSFQFLKIKKLPRRFSFFIICLAAVMNFYTFKIRPQTITLILLLLECIALEKYQITNKKVWLLLLPLSMLLEVNLHSSMCVMHFAILAAYMVPFVKNTNITNTDLHKQWKQISIFAILMLLMMWLNPYGIDGILYLFNSFKADTFSIVSVRECLKTTVLSSHGIVILFCSSLTGFLIYKKKINSIVFYMNLGLIFLMLLAFRHNMFSFLCVLFSARGLYELQQETKITIKITNRIQVYFLIAITVFSAFIGSIVYELHSTGQLFGKESLINRENLNKIVTYIDQNKTSNKEDLRIFTGFNTGGYFEYCGFTNIYIDARPELYMSKINKQKDVLKEYRNYVMKGYYTSDGKYIHLTNSDIQNFLNLYNFDFLVIDADIETFLYGYLTHNTDYKQVYQVDNFVLYERI